MRIEVSGVRWQITQFLTISGPSRWVHWRVCGLRHIAYVCAGGPGVKITTAVRTYTFSCAEPDRLISLLNSRS